MKRAHLNPAIALLLAFIPVAQAQNPDTHALRAGAATVDISPKTLPALMNGGFLQRSANRVVDPLYARSLVISDGKETIAIVIVDSCMFPRTLCDEIKRLATKQTGLPANRILISATHTHSAPAAMQCLGCPPDEAYVKYVPGRVAQAIQDAKDKLQPAKLGYGIVDGSDLTNCRRWITRSDKMGPDPFGGKTVRAMMHPGYLNRLYTSPAGPIDPWLSVFSVVSAKDEKPICVMGNLSMHYFGGGGFSADYFGEVNRILETRFGKTGGKGQTKFVGIMSQGTSGDLHWMDYGNPRKTINRSQYAARVADRVLQAWKGIEHRSDLSIAMAEKRLTIGRRLPSKERLEWARKINASRGERVPKNRTEVYAFHAEWIHENPKEEVVLQAVRIGELGITAIPCEVYGITGLKLKRQSPLPATFNLELANGGAGYIPPPEQFYLGGYTTWPARSAGLVEQAEPLIVKTVLELLESVSGRKQRALVDPMSPYAKAVTDMKPVAYWRLADMYATQVTDAMGKNHASFKGGVALFLPGPNGEGFNAKGYGSRAVYLAGGHIEGQVRELDDDYSVSMWFYNGLPTDARDVTGTLLSSTAETLLIAGRAAGEQSGTLVLRSGQKSSTGRTRVQTKQWHHVTITRANNRIRVYLDGNPKPEIETQHDQAKLGKQLLIGHSGNADVIADPTFDGKVDDVAVFDRALAANEIVDLFAKSKVTAPPTPKPVLVLGPKPTDAASRKEYAEVLNTSKPIAYWRLHDKSTRSANDSVGESAATYEKGASPLQVEATKPNFSGGRVKATVPKLGNTYSVALWFRNDLPVDSRSVTAYILSRGTEGANGAPGDNLGIGGTYASSGKLIVFNGNQRNELVAGTTQIPRGGWSYVVMIRQGKRIKVYLNGDPKPEIDADLPATFPADCKEFLLGGRSDNFANLQGMLEEVAVFDRVLTPKEIKTHFEAAGVKQIEKEANAQQDRPEEPVPTEAAESQKTIHVPSGFKVQIVAAEPLVMDPVAIDWGTDGKLWVVEMADYPLGMDNKGKPGGRVRFLEDTNGDGKYDKSTLFADGLSFPTGILVWGNGVLVTAAPQILYMEDTSGNGKADVRRVLYSGFMEGNQQLRVNGLRSGLDNWVYCASGSHHGGYGKNSQITSHLTGKKVHIGSRDFRIRPNTGAIDPQSGPSQYGRTRDDWGNWFGVQNSHPLWHYVLADHHIRRNPHFAPPDPKRQIVTPTNPKVYPASKMQKRYHSFNQSGRFTSACSPMIYRDDYLFDRGAEQHAFTCEPFHNLVQHNLISHDGVSFKFRRDPEEKDTDLFASEDRWCRPVMVRTGPDGALWVVDMYRYMIEHPQWLPKHGQDELRPWYRAGEDRGRIYRVVRNAEPARQTPRLSGLSAPQLVAALESPNGWQRDTAQRLLVNGKKQSVVAPLKTMATKSTKPLARLHALATLDGLGALSVDTLEAALSDSNAGVRRHAVRIAARVVVDVNKLATLVEDRDAKVRLELASTLGAYDESKASAVIAKLAVASNGDRYLTAAVMSSLNTRNVSAVLSAVIRSAGPDPVTRELIGQAVAMSKEDSIGDVVELVCAPQGKRPGKTEFESLARLLHGLAKRKWPLQKLSATSRDRIAKIISYAREAVTDVSMGEDIRAASIQLLAREENRLDDDFKLIQRQLVPQSPMTVQTSVLTYLARRTEASIPGILLSGWHSHSPDLRQQIIGVLASRKLWAESLRMRLESGTLRVSDLSVSVRQRLLTSNKNDPRWQKALAAKATTNRSKVLEQFRPALKLNGDARRGEVLFRKLCITCHKYKNEGHDVGPQLASITNKTKQAFLVSILDPNAVVDARYLSYLVRTTDGRDLTGRLETETGSSITLLAAGGIRTTVLRRDIEELRASTLSLMPEGLEHGLKPQDLADLIEFVLDAYN